MARDPKSFRSRAWFESNDRDGFLSFLDNEIHGQEDIASIETMTGLKNFKNQFLLKRNWS